MAKKYREMETHHNQKITRDAAEKVPGSKGRSSQKKIIALKLEPREALALKHLGGIQGLKALLCPEGLCIYCRRRDASPESPEGAYCSSCQKRIVES